MKLRRVILIFLPLLAVTVLLGLCFGSVSLSRVLAGEETARLILWQLRLPRVAAGVLAGLGLSTAGVLLQTVTANDLAGPNIIGVNSGAGLAVIGLLTFAPGAGKLLPLAAFLGAFAAALLIAAVAGRMGASRSGIVLIGIAVTTVFNAAISFLSLLDEGVLAQYNNFTVGSLKGVRLEELLLPAVLIFAAFLGSLAIGHSLGTLCLGDAAAAALGVRVKALRLTALALAAACAAAVVSFAGLLGFVGLMVPHISRALVGPRPRKLLIASALVGGVLVVLADLLGRVLAAPSELPVGILLSLVGGPYFLILLVRRKRHAGI